MALQVRPKMRRAVGNTLARCSQRCAGEPHNAEALADGLKIYCPLADSLLRWRAIEGMAETSTHTFVLLTDMSGYVFPRVGLTAGDAEQFASAIRGFLNGRGA